MIRRQDWEQAGYRIREHTGAPAVDIDDIDEIVFHYPGASGPISTLSPITYVQNMQRSWVNRPAPNDYSIGYSWGYWPDGTEIELRGYDFRNAANAVPGDRGKTNRRTLSLFLIVGRQDPATAAQIDAVRHRRRQINTRAGRPVPSTRHRDLEPTMCPGAGIAAQHDAGMFDPAPIPNPQPKDDPMYLIPPPPERPGGRWLVTTPAGYRLANSHDIDEFPHRPLTDAYRVQQYDDALAVASNRQVPA